MVKIDVKAGSLEEQLILREAKKLKLNATTSYIQESISKDSRVGIFSKDKKTIIYTGKVVKIQSDGNYEVKVDQKTSTSQSTIVVTKDQLIEIKPNKLSEARAGEVQGALDKFLDDNNLYHFEGSRAMQNFEKVVNALGYRNTDEFFEDNSGCFEAMLGWIGSQRNQEWIDGLGGDGEEEE